MQAPKAQNEASGFLRKSARSWTLRAIESLMPNILSDLEKSGSDEWAARWFSGARWATTTAKMTKDYWGILPADQPKQTFGRYGGGLFAGREIKTPEPFPYAPWNPDRENASQYRVRLKAEFMKHLDAQIEAQKRERKISRLPDDVKLERDARWLVRYHFRRETFAEIARGGGSAQIVSPDTVRKAVQNVAQLIEIDLRAPDLAGRPPNQPD